MNPALRGDRDTLSLKSVGAETALSDTKVSRPSPVIHEHKRSLRFRGMLRPNIGNRREARWSQIEKSLWKGLFVPRFPAVKRVCRIVQSLQNELNMVCDQSSVADSQKALKITGVIYAIVCCSTKRIYVGQTIKSALQRYREHWNRAKNGASEPLHAAMRKFGAERFALVPLELIKASEYANVRATKGDKFRKVRAFHKVASPRELFWIDRLRSFSPEGFNVRIVRSTMRCSSSARTEGPAPERKTR